MVRIRISVPIYSFIMKYLLFSTFVFLQLHLLSQNFSITEQQHWGTTGPDGFTNVERTSDGGYLLFGNAAYLNNTLSDTLYGSMDYWVIRLDSNKNMLWNKTYGGSSTETAANLLKLSNGNFLLIGNSYSPASGRKTDPGYGNIDVWVVCINEYGDQLWDKCYGTTSPDNPGSAINISENRFAMIVNTIGGATGNKTLPSKGDSDGWIIELDTLGTILNEHVIGGDSTDFLGNIQRLNNGHYLFLCNSRSGVSGDKNSTNFGNNDAWVIETDTNFIIVNQFAFGGTGVDFLGLIVEKSNSYLFIGGSESPISGNKTSPKRCVNSDAIILQTDKNFTVLNEKSFGHSSATYYLINDYMILPNNEVVFAGCVNGNASPFNSRISHSFDFWLMQVDDNLNQNWNYSFGSSGSEYIVKGFVNSNYELEIFGFLDAPASYDISVSTFGGTDILYAKLSSDLSVLESQLAVGVYPNPSRGIFHVTSATPISAYSVFSVDGRLQAIGATLTGSLDLQHLPTGTYIAHFVSGKTSSSVKLVIE